MSLESDGAGEVLPADAPPSEWLRLVGLRLEQQQPFLAFDIARAGAAHYPNEDALPLAAARALMQAQSYRAARKLIGDYPESIDLSLSVPAREQLAEILRLGALHEADADSIRRGHRLYDSLFQETGRPRYALQAAMMALQQGSAEQARHHAAMLETTCGPDDDFETLLLCGHAGLLLGAIDDAGRAYAQASKAAGSNYQAVLSARRDLRHITHAGLSTPADFLDLFRPPVIVVCGGQPLDPPDVETAILPASKEAALKAAIATQLERLDARIGYAGAACGSDILFAEALLERGGELHVVLPCALNDFIDARVSYGGIPWVERLHQVLAQATTVSFATTERYLGHKALLRYANHMTAGNGWLRGQLLDSPPHLLAVWDYRAPNIPGSSSDFIDHWPDASRLHLIELDQLSTETEASPAACAAPVVVTPPVQSSGSERVIRTMLFADVVGYSKLGEEFLPQWFQFLRHIQDSCTALGLEPALVEAWGDAFYVVMPDARSIVRYAFALRRAFTGVDHSQFGLPYQLNIRIGLHAGPVYREIHPLSGRVVFMGRQVNRAARIEPITIPGEVYASQELVALLTVEDNSDRNEQAFSGEPYAPWFQCEYLGFIDLPKGHGQQQVYHLLPAVDEQDSESQAPAGARQVLHLSLRNDLQELTRLAEIVERFAIKNQLSETDGHNLGLALDEIVTNIMRTGFTKGSESERIEVVLRADEDWLRAEIVDDGRPFNPLTDSPMPELDDTLSELSIEGLGLHLVRSVMEEMDYRREGGFNRLRLARRRHPQQE